MSKIKPNDPCQCGSGKKAKKCCGTNAQQPLVTTETPKIDGTLGLSGIPLLMNVVPINSIKRDKPNPSGVQGKYKASFLLGKPNQPPIDENHLTFEFDQMHGNSHLFIGDPDDVFVNITANLPDGNSGFKNYDFEGYANAEGYLSKIVIEKFDALNIQDAMDQAFNALYPILSRMSILNNVPAFVHRWAIVELATQNHMSSFTLPFLNQHAPILDNVPKDADFETFASLFREGLNSNSPNYQFLCFFKIIEGIRKIKEERARKENQQVLLTGNKPVRPREILPSDAAEQQAWLRTLYGKQKWSGLAIAQVFSSGAGGRKINDLIAPSKELDTVRNKIAHTVLRDESLVPLTTDDSGHIREVANWLPLCKSLALYLLKQEYSTAFGTGVKN